MSQPLMNFKYSLGTSVLTSSVELAEMFVWILQCPSILQMFFQDGQNSVFDIKGN